MTKLGIAFTGAPYSLEECVKHVKAAESRGFETFWFMEDYFFRDAFTVLTKIAVETRKIRLGTGVINPFTRHPALIAASIASLDDISNTRAILGIGAGAPGVMMQMTEYLTPMRRLRESIRIIRDLLSKSNVTYEGTTTFVKDATLGICPYFDPFGRWKIPRHQIPIYVAGMGPKMLQLAGELGDGVITSLGCSPKHVERAIQQVSIGASKANRNIKDIDTAVYINLSPSRDGTVDDSTKGFVSICVSQFFDPQTLKELYNIDEDTIRRLRAAFDKGGYGEAAKYVTKDVANNFGASGTKEECQEILSKYEKAGAKTLVIVPTVKQNADLAMETAHEYVS